MVNSNIGPNSAPLRDMTLWNLSDLDFNPSRSWVQGHEYNIITSTILLNPASLAGWGLIILWLIAATYSSIYVQCIYSAARDTWYLIYMMAVIYWYTCFSTVQNFSTRKTATTDSGQSHSPQHWALLGRSPVKVYPYSKERRWKGSRLCTRGRQKRGMGQRLHVSYCLHVCDYYMPISSLLAKFA